MAEFVTLKHSVTGKKVKFLSKGGIGALSGSRVQDFLVNAAGLLEPLDVVVQPSGRILGPTDRLRDFGVVSGDVLTLQPKPAAAASASAPPAPTGASAGNSSGNPAFSAAAATAASASEVPPSAAAQPLDARKLVADTTSEPARRSTVTAAFDQSSAEQPSRGTPIAHVVSSTPFVAPPGDTLIASAETTAATRAPARDQNRVDNTNNNANNNTRSGATPSTIKAEISDVARRLLSPRASSALPILDAEVFDSRVRCFATESMLNALKTGETRSIAQFDGECTARASGRVCDPRTISEHAMADSDGCGNGARMLLIGPPGVGRTRFALKSCLDQPFAGRPAVYLPLTYLFSSASDLPSAAASGSTGNTRSLKDALCRFLQDANACDGDQVQLGGAVLGPLCDPNRAFPVVWYLDDLDIVLNRDPAVMSQFVPEKLAAQTSLAPANNNNCNHDDEEQTTTSSKRKKKGINNSNSTAAGAAAAPGIIIIRPFDTLCFLSRDGVQRDHFFSHFSVLDVTEWRLFRWSAADEYRFCWGAVGDSNPAVLSITRAVREAFEQHPQLTLLRGCPLTTKILAHLALRGADLANIKSLSEAFELLVRAEIGSTAAAAADAVNSAIATVSRAALRLVRDQVTHEAAFPLTEQLEKEPWLRRLVDAGLLHIVGRSEGELKLDGAQQGSFDKQHRGPRVVFCSRFVTELFAHMYLFKGSDQPKLWDWNSLCWNRADRQLWTLIAGRVASRAAHGNPKETFAFRAATSFFICYNDYRRQEGADAIRDTTQSRRHRVNVFAALAVELSAYVGAHVLVDEILKQHGMFMTPPSHLRWMIPLCGRFGANDTLRFLVTKVQGGAKMLSAQEMADLYLEAVIGGQRPEFFHQLHKVADISLDMNSAADFGAVSPLVFAIDDARRTNQNLSPVFLRRVYRCLDQAIARDDSDIKSALLAALPLTESFEREHQLECEEAMACLSARMALWAQYMVHWQPHASMMWESMFSSGEEALVAQFFDGVAFNNSVALTLVNQQQRDRQFGLAVNSSGAASGLASVIAESERFITRCSVSSAAHHFVTKVTLLEGHPMVGKTTFGIKLCLLQPFPEHVCIYFDVRSLQTLRKTPAMSPPAANFAAGNSKGVAAAAAPAASSGAPAGLPTTLEQLWALLAPPIDCKAPVMWVFDNVDRLPKDVEAAFGHIMMDLATSQPDKPVFINDAILFGGGGANNRSSSLLAHEATAENDTTGNNNNYNNNNNSDQAVTSRRRRDRCILLSRVMRGGCPFLAKSSLCRHMRIWVLPHRTEAQEEASIRSYFRRAGAHVQGLHDPRTVEDKTGEVMGKLRATSMLSGIATNIRGVRLLLKWICRLTVFADQFAVPDCSDPLVVIEAEMRRRCCTAGFTQAAQQEKIIDVTCVSALRSFRGGFPFSLRTDRCDDASDGAAAALTSEEVESMLRCGFVSASADMRTEGFAFKASEVELFAVLSLRRAPPNAHHFALLHWSAAFECIWKLAAAALSPEEFIRISWNPISRALEIDPEVWEEEVKRLQEDEEEEEQQQQQQNGATKAAAAGGPPTLSKSKSMSLNNLDLEDLATDKNSKATKKRKKPLQHHQQQRGCDGGDVAIIPYFLALELSDQQPSVLLRARILSQSLRRKLDLSVPCGVFGALQILREHLSAIQSADVFENVKVAALRKLCEYYNAEQAAEYKGVLVGATCATILLSAVGGNSSSGGYNSQRTESQMALADSSGFNFSFAPGGASAAAAAQAAAATQIHGVASPLRPGGNNGNIGGNSNVFAQSSASQFNVGRQSSMSSASLLRGSAADGAPLAADRNNNSQASAGAGGSSAAAAAAAGSLVSSSSSLPSSPPLTSLLGKNYIFTKHTTGFFSSSHDRFVRIELVVFDAATQLHVPHLVWSEDTAGTVGRHALNMKLLRAVAMVQGEGWTFSLTFDERSVKLTAKSEADFTLWWRELDGFSRNPQNFQHQL